MQRRRKPNIAIIEEGNSQDRWLISYADFITLLFAFFVVMYSISQVNEGKYKVLSESLVAAFKLPERSNDPIQVGDINLTNLNPIEQGTPEQTDNEIDDGWGTRQATEIDVESEALTESFKKIKQELDESLQELIKAKLVTIRSNQDWIEVDMRSGLLFGSGSAAPAPAATPLISEIASILKDKPNEIKVRGYTDNIPISNESFASNWDLSSLRAVRVVHLLLSNGVAANRLAVEGYGEFRPIADNLSAEGRAKNRRVVIAISRYRVIPQTFDDEETEVITDDKAGDKLNVKVENNEKTVTESKAELDENSIEIIRLPDGGLLIRGKSDTAKDENGQ